MRWWISSFLSVSLAFVAWGSWGCTLVPNPALAGGESTSDASTSTGEPGESTSDASTSTGEPGTSTSDASTSTADASDSSDTGIEPACGNGIVEGAEACDEQGPTAACDEDCTLVSCGDALVNAAAGEACDEGGATETCNQDCTLAGCGDGVLNVAAGEQCDDAGETAACDVDCTPVECGDGLVNTTVGEACDAGGETPACNANCTVPDCGDGITNVALGEQCDGGGETAACDGDCTVVVCGDATINALAGEICEATDLGGQTCEGVGYGAGTLACSGCTAYVTSNCTPAMPVLSLTFSPIKRFDFSWGAVVGADYYQLEESTGPGEPFVHLGGDIVGASVSHEMPLHLRWQASYRLQACNAAGCTESATVDVVGSLVDAVGYVKASNTGASDRFGESVALSGDGSTLAVGAVYEASNATGVGGNQADNSAVDSGAVYVFTRDGLGAWSQQAYVKASNTGAGDLFGRSVALSGDGSTLAVGAWYEDSNATGVGGNQADDTAFDSGAVYLY